MSETHHSKISSTPSDGLVLLGIKSGRPHAARFHASESELAAKAAKLMGLHLVILDSPEKVEASSPIPYGKIFSSGKSFCPYTKQSVFDKIASLSQVDLHEDVNPKPLLEETNEASANQVNLVEMTPRLPLNWDDLGPGCLCLASEGEGHGWFMVIVLATTPEGFVVAWHDFRDLENFVRRSDELALLPPSFGTPNTQANA